MRRFLSVTILCAVLGSREPSAVRAMEVPETAESISLGVPSLLLDGAALGHAFPTASLLEPAQLQGVSGGNGTSLAVGAFLPLGPGRIFAAAQRNAGPPGLLLHQVGGGMPLSRFRIGVALRGGANSRDFESLDGRLKTRSTVGEVALGLGSGTGTRRVDLFFSVTDPRSSRSTTFGPSGFLVKTRLDHRPIPGVGIRSIFRLGSGARWTVAAIWAGRTLESDAVLEGVSIRQTTSWRRSQRYALVGTSIQAPAGSLDRVGIHASYAGRIDSVEDRFPEVWLSKTVEGRFGLFVVEDVGRGWTTLGGIRTTYSEREDELRFFSQPQDGPVTLWARDSSKSFGRRASWGLQKRLRGLSLTGAIDMTLELRSLITYLDFSFDL